MSSSLSDDDEWLLTLSNLSVSNIAARDTFSLSDPSQLLPASELELFLVAQARIL